MTQNRLRLTILLLAAIAAANPLLAGRRDRAIADQADVRPALWEAFR